MNFPQRFLYLFEEAPISLAHFAARFADDEMMYRPLKNKLIAFSLSKDPEFLDDTELFEHLQITVDARSVDAGELVLKMCKNL